MWARICFNPRTREGATYLSASNTQVLHRFNPRTREGATACPLQLHQMGWVSIHAPVKVRPVIEAATATLKNVSIHAPVKVRHDAAF